MAAGTSTTGLGDATSRISPRTPLSSSPRLHQSPQGVSGQSSSIGSSSPQERLHLLTSVSTPLSTDDSKKSTEKKIELLPVNASTASPALSTSSAKGDPSDDEPSENERIGYSPSVLNKVWDIFACFIVRTPTVFISSVLITYPLMSYFYKESYAVQAAYYVGIAGFVYNFFNAFSSEIIPEYRLSKKSREGKLWRNAIDLTNTWFITTAFTSAVWKLPEITSLQGFILFGVTYGLTNLFSKSYYPNLHKQPTWSQQRL